MLTFRYQAHGRGTILKSLLCGEGDYTMVAATFLPLGVRAGPDRENLKLTPLVGRALLLTGRRYDGIVAAIHRGKAPCPFKPCAIRDLRAAACTMLSRAGPAWAA